MTTRRILANAIRFLSMDAVQKAQSGHPGMPMGMADIAEVLWNDFLRHNPANPNWINRDRFVLSNGHGSMLLYSVLHLSGYDLSIEDLKAFRQLHSRTPGHPESFITPGVEATTGPLGQGLANAVGFALAERLLAHEFNQPNHEIIDHYTYCFVGDGCLMEGISHEAGSLAGTLGLNKLIVLWDDNGISIDGKVVNWFRDDTPQRFRAYGWNVVNEVDGHNPEAIKNALQAARTEQNRPTLICCQTQIGFGSPKLAGTEKTHGSPLGADEIAATRIKLEWPYPAFEIPAEIQQAWDAKAKGQVAEQQWLEQWQTYSSAFPELAQELQRRLHKKLPDNWSAVINDLLHSTQKAMPVVASRKASQNVLDAITQYLPELLGGSADLSCSNLTTHKHAKTIMPNELNGNYVNYGVREFGMSAIMNGLALHGGFIPFGGTFLTFCDYARNAIRMSALMRLRVIYVYTHDSIGLGEDGPTHQPIEHLTMLRVTPNVSVWRPCDAAETVVAWQAAIERQNGPTCLSLSRQNLPSYWRSETMLAQIKCGGYILQDCSDFPNAIIIATGSEVEIAVAAADQLTRQGLKIRVVSMPCVDVFLQQSAIYRSEVLPETVTARVVVEAGSREYWYQFTGLTGKIIGLHTYGESAPTKDVYAALGITADAVIAAVQQCLTVNGD
jgi:transketolase